MFHVVDRGVSGVPYGFVYPQRRECLYVVLGVRGVLGILASIGELYVFTLSRCTSVYSLAKGIKDGVLDSWTTDNPVLCWVFLALLESLSHKEPMEAFQTNEG